MPTATDVGRCPWCDEPHPCPTQIACIRAWGEMLLGMLPDDEEDPYGFGD
jgi:hypothetical protein